MPVFTKHHTQQYFFSDEQFNQLYPASIQALARRHWTPLAIARQAAQFLATEAGVRILDIGSGAGKFCLSAAYYQPRASFFGIEQRHHLVRLSEYTRDRLGLENASFIHGNFSQVDFTGFNHFYFYNSFYENLSHTDKIDDSIAYSPELYHYYNRYLHKQLDRMPAGTRVATFHCSEDELPGAYHIVGTEMNQLLKFWIKV